MSKLRSHIQVKTKYLSNSFIIIAILLVLMISLIPLYWTFIVSISPEVEINSVPPHWFPHKPTYTNYLKILFSSHGTRGASYAFKEGLVNSLIISVIVTVIALFIGSLAAYSIVKLKVPFANVITIFILLSQMLPPVVLVIPLYFIGAKIGLLDTKTVLIIIYLGLNLPLAIWILQAYFKTLPDAIEDSALIDGCSRVQSLFKIVLPLSGPALFTAGLFLFLASWNEFLMALVFTSTINSKTMPVAMAEMIGRFFTDYGLMATAGILGSIIPLLFAAVFQRYLISGITGGSVKM